MKTYYPLICLTILLMLVMGGDLFAQGQGTIRGRLTDASTGEPVLFANVVIKNTSPLIGGQSDLDGNYQFKVEEGVYILEATFVGFANKTIEGVVVKAGEVTVLDFLMEEESQVIGEVIVKAERIDRTENAILALQMKAATIQDGLSSQEMSRYGSSNAAESMKRVTGASVVDGKYIYVRGLGDRYSSAQLNGQQLPSTDPYRNSTQLDLIPANLLENVIASKSFTPDQPGNFTGGNVNMQTKSFPEQFTLSVTTSMSINTVSNFNDNFLTYNGGSNDWLGYDDGTRELPEMLADQDVRDMLTSSLRVTARNLDSASTARRMILDETVRSVNPQMQGTRGRSGMNYGMGVALGNQYSLFGNPLGVLIGVNYRRNYSMYDNGLIANWEIPGASADQLNGNFNLNSNKSTDNPQIGGLFNLAYKFGGSQKISFNYLYNHDTENTTMFLQGPYEGIFSGNRQFQSRSLLFMEREIESFQLNGEHVMKSLNNVKLEWGASIVNNSQLEPDLRFFSNAFNPPSGTETDTTYSVNLAEIGNRPAHFWRVLEDEQKLVKADITIPIAQSKSLANNIKVGAFYSTKDRMFSEDRFQYEERGDGVASYIGDPVSWFGSENIGDLGLNEAGNRHLLGLFLTDVTADENQYTGTEEITAAYGMFTYDFDKLKIIAGLRVEDTDINVASGDTSITAGNIQQTDLLPSVNFIYKLQENKEQNSMMNLRASFSQTLARPNMRELAPFSSFEFLGGFIYTGNPELERTLTENYDLRWEWFPRPGEIFAVSSYFKNFKNPIINRFLPKAQNPEIKFENVEQATVYGVELEFRKKLDFLSPSLANFKVSSNLSFIYSEVDIPEDELFIQDINPEFGDTRPFQGQSDILFNSALSYVTTDGEWDALLSYNVFSERLATISQGGTPDIYEQPRPQLNLNVKKQFGNHLSVRLGVQNITDSKFIKTMSFKGEQYTVEEYPLGRTFSVNLSYKI